MAATRKLTVEVLGDAKSVHGAFKGIADGTDSLGKQFTDFGKKVGIAFTAVAAGTAVLAKTALDAAYEAQKVSAQTDAIVKATGKAAGLTGKQVQQLADALSFKTGVDDEAIQSSMNMLLTFKQVRNEAGKGNQIFTRASAAMMDLGNVFGSTESAAMQLGKALSDPVKGIGSLRRAGVNFTKAQQDQIKALVESGDLLGAQKIILAEVESQVGGTAAATATSAARMKVAFENLQERVGKLLLPAFEGLARAIVEKVIPAIEDIVDKYGPPLARFFSGLFTKAQKVGAVIADNLFPILKKVGSWMADNTKVVATFFAVVAGAAVLASLAALAAAIAGLFNPLTLIIGAVALAAAGFVYAYQHFETFRNVVDGVARFITGTVIPAVVTAFGWLGSQITAFANGVRSRWDDIRAATQNVFDFVRGFIQGVLSVLQYLWDVFGGTIVASVRRAWDAISNIVAGAFGIVRGLFDVFLGLLSGHWSRVWDGLKSAVWGALQGVLGIAQALWNPIVSTFSAIWEAVKRAASAPFSALVAIVKGAVNTVIDVVNKFVDIWNAIQFTAPRIHIPGTNWTVGGFTIGLPDLPKIPHLAQGGVVMTPSIVEVAERGPEAIVPLSRFEQPSGDTKVEINVSGGDPQAVVNALRKYMRQNGTVPVKVGFV